jgi:hypothetical protein
MLLLAEQLPRVFILSCKPLSDFGFQTRRPLWGGIVFDVRQFHGQGNGIHGLPLGYGAALHVYQ